MQDTRDDLEPLRLRRQWLVAAGTPAREGWPTIDLGAGFRLHHHPHALVSSFEFGEATIALVGVAVDADGFLDRLANDRTDPLHERVVRTLDHLVGCYAVITHTPRTGVRVYTDPAALMNVFFKDGYAASTPALLHAGELDTEPSRGFRLNEIDDWMTGTRTPFVGVRVVLANHWLDLGSGAQHRFWPRQQFPQRTVEDAVSSGAAHLRASANALLQQHPVLLSLTGGLDSRVMLAACRDRLDRVRAFTIETIGEKERELVGRLVATSGVDHRWVAFTPPEPWILELYDEMTGGQSLGSRRRVAGACMSLAAPDAVHLSGNLGAIAKSFYWPKGVASWPTPHMLTRDFLQRGGPIEAGAHEWLQTLPQDLTPEAACNLMYLEQRGSRWMGIGETASNLFYAPVTLFASRSLFELICSVPAQFQRDGYMLRAFARSLWPELADVPYHTGTKSWKRMLPKRLKAFARSVSGKNQK